MPRLYPPLLALVEFQTRPSVQQNSHCHWVVVNARDRRAEGGCRRRIRACGTNVKNLPQGCPPDLKAALYYKLRCGALTETSTR